MEELKRTVQDLILRGFKLSYVFKQLNINKKQAQEFIIHPSRSEIANYQITYIRNHYTDKEIEDAFLALKGTDDLQTKINRLEYHTLGCAFGLYKKVFEALLGAERFGIVSREFRKQKTEKTVMERYGVRSISMNPDVIKKRKQTMAKHENNGAPKKKLNIQVSDEVVAQVKDLSLRGFNRQYIRKKLNLSQPAMQLIGFHPSRDDIIEYQVHYIGEHYSSVEIEAALYAIHNTEDFQALANRHELYALGCSFGSIAQPFSKLLTSTKYQKIVYDHVRQKQQSSGTLEGAREQRRLTMLERYGVEHPNQNAEIAERMVQTAKQTNMQRYGVDHPMKVKEEAVRRNEKRRETMMQRYGAANSVQIPEIRERIMETRRRNGTLSTSIYEAAAKKILLSIFGEDDVQCSIKVDERYPYHVDFYIKSRDLFIEMNVDASHQKHWFDPESEEDAARLAILQERADGLNRPSRYRNNIRVWTELDPEKRVCAKKNNLNYLVFWDGSTHISNGKRIPLLRDFQEWIDAGCPDAQDWPGHEANKC